MAPITSGSSGEVQVLYGNQSQTLVVPSTNIVMLNGTLIQIMLKKPFRDSEINELLYVIIVIVFYATALMTLIITQIKRQRREGMDVDYYDEYLQRNQEVKRTCQTATTLVLKTDKPTQASGSKVRDSSGTTSGVSSASLTLLPARRLDTSPRAGTRLGVGRSSGGYYSDDGLYTPSVSPRELSPMLESIPDIGT